MKVGIYARLDAGAGQTCDSRDEKGRGEKTLQKWKRVE